MCTVTYLHSAGNIYITSNRDENKLRKNAALPETELRNGHQITFPKDPVAGGSWFAISEIGRVAVLLNGAAKKHLPVYPYRKSRGLILLELISDRTGPETFEKTDLHNIEPFTIIFFEPGKLFQLQWNGLQKTQKKLDCTYSYIWSSSTLFTEEVIQERKKLFNHFISSIAEIKREQIIRFHHNNYEDFENGFIINRESGIISQSMTQAVIKDSHLSLYHHDLINGQSSKNTILLSQKSTIETPKTFYS